MMKEQHKTPDLERLLADARSAERDRRRREQLSAMIDQWAENEAEAAPVRHRIVPRRWIGIAASLLLVAAAGLYLMRQPSHDAGDLTAKSHNGGTEVTLQPTAPCDSTTAIEDDGVPVKSQPAKRKRAPKVEEPIPTLLENEAESPVLLAEVDAEAAQEEAPETVDSDEPQAEAQPQVFERRSTRLVNVTHRNSAHYKPMAKEAPEPQNYAFIGMHNTWAYIPLWHSEPREARGEASEPDAAPRDSRNGSERPYGWSPCSTAEPWMHRTSGWQPPSPATLPTPTKKDELLH